LALPAVLDATPTERGALVFTANREDVPAVVATCVAEGSSVFGVEPRDPNLEDVYFAIEAQATLAGAGPPLEGPVDDAVEVRS
jgi:hypothetical protein